MPQQSSQAHTKSYDPRVRAAEKEAARRADEQALALGRKAVEQLSRENSHFTARGARLDLEKAKSRF